MKFYRFQTESLVRSADSLDDAKRLVRERYPEARFERDEEDACWWAIYNTDQVATIHDKPPCSLCDNQQAGMVSEHSEACRAQYLADTAL